jgi:signal recognition particle GTPase
MDAIDVFYPVRVAVNVSQEWEMLFLWSKEHNLMRMKQERFKGRLLKNEFDLTTPFSQIQQVKKNG